jgi:hypothetical protein
LAYALLPESYHSTAGAAVEFSAAGRATAAVLAWMSIWWLTEAIDVEATALLPLVLLPLLGAASFKNAAAPYGDEFIFLFMGGFILALAMQQRRLTREDQDTEKAVYPDRFRRRGETNSGFDYAESGGSALAVSDEERRATFERLWAEGGFAF